MTRSPPVLPAAGGEVASGPRRSVAASAVLAVAGSLVFIVLMALGAWQVHRLSWKLDLIARVDARVHAPPSPAPRLPEWPSVGAATDEYRHIAARGVYIEHRDTLVQAVTELGGGFWVLTPLRTDAGFTVLVNRGFVAHDGRDPQALRPSAGETSVVGLLRISEPNGAFLRHNDPAADRWYSRDVPAIAAARGLGAQDAGPVAPYFIDAEASPGGRGYPVGGLTIVAFPNNHLVYALTWFGLAAMLAGALAWVARDEIRLRGRSG